MASRKEQKDQARVQRLAKEQAAAAQAARTRRIQIFGGVIVVAVIIIVAAIALSGGGQNKATQAVQKGQTTPQTQAAVKTVDAELAGIPQNGETLGSPTAKVTMQYFGDLQCPICADFTTGNEGGALPQVIKNLVRTDKVKIVYESFCTATCSASNPAPGGGTARFSSQQADAYAAGLQNKFWYYAELMYHEQGTEDSGYVTNGFLTGLAKQVESSNGLNYSKWLTDTKDPNLTDQVTTGENLAGKYGLEGTPSLVMIGPKGKTLVDDGNFAPYSDFVSSYNQVA